MPVSSIFGGLSAAAGAAGNIASLFGGDSKGPQLATGFKKPIITPTYTFGGGKLVRNNEDILNQQRRQRELIGGLQGEVKPGFGRLTDTGVQAIRNRAASQVGNLRAQQAQRGLSGASFASDALNRLQRDYDEQENLFRGQAFQAEMEASTALIDRDLQLTQAQTQRELTELGITTDFLSVVNQTQVNQANIKKALTEYNLVQGLSESATTGVPLPGNIDTPKKKKTTTIGRVGEK